MNRMKAILCIMIIVFFCNNVAYAVNPTTITILESEKYVYPPTPRMQYAISTFEERNPGYRVEIVSIPENKMLTALMAGDGDIDIVSGYDDMYSDLVRHGVLYDLMQYPGFEQVVEDWTDIKPLFMKGESLYGVPSSFIEFNYKWNVPLAEHLEIGISNEHMSWIDFEELMDRMKESRNRLTMQDSYLFAETKMTMPIFLRHYTSAYYDDMINGEMDYNTQEFKELLQLWKKAIDDHLLYMYESMYDVDFSKVLIQSAVWVENETEGPYFLFPQLAKRSTPVVALSLGVFSGSDHRDKAAELLQIYASKESALPEFPAEGLFLEDITYWDQYNETDFPKEYYLHLHSMLQNSSRNFVNESMESKINELWPSYLEGNITDDQFIDGLNEAFQRSIDG